MQNHSHEEFFSHCGDDAARRFGIIAKREPNINAKERAELKVLADRIAGETKGLDKTALFGADVSKGCGSGVAIIFGDSSEIPLISREDGHRLEYRMGFLAREGDLVILGGRICNSFQTYQMKILGLEKLEYLSINAREMRSLPGACLRNLDIFEKLCRYVRKNNGATIIPYLATPAVWALSSKLANETDCHISVAGPPGSLSNFANSKIWFSRIATEVFGSHAMLPRRYAHGVAALVRHVLALAQNWPKLVIKVPNSAGSAGNFVIRSDAIRGLRAKVVGSYLRAHLSGHGWPGRYLLVVEVWDTDVLTSPSVQLWIPNLGNDDPVIEGVFEQILVGEKGAFAGAARAALPKAIDDELCDQAFRLALLFQHLGYYGRCSFDGVLVGSDISRAIIHWIECNARWGGVSIPMSFVKRRKIKSDFAIMQASGLTNPPRSFSSALTEFSDVIWWYEQDNGIVFINPNGIEAGTGCQFLSFAKTTDDAKALSEYVFSRLQNVR